MSTSISLPVRDRSQAGEARRAAAVWGLRNGWGEDLAARVALIITELGHNLALHTIGGSLILRSISDGDAIGVEILSLDSGPGVANFNNCIHDGFSTAGTSGTGLGAVKRASQRFAFHSQPGIGTVLLSEVWSRTPHFHPARTFHSGAVSIPFPRETLCGDSWAELHLRPGIFRVVIADGLGHGDYAAEASTAAIAVFTAHPGLDLTELLQRMHGALRSTRGAAIAIAELDLPAATLSYIGVGNIAGAILTGTHSTSLVSLNGTVGAQFRTLRLFTYPWTPGSTLIMGSDGLKSHLQLDKYIGLRERHPALLAGVIHRDFTRGTDDSTIVTVRALDAAAAAAA